MENGLAWEDSKGEVVKVLFEYLRAEQESKVIKNLRSLNKHWRSSISRLVTSMKPAVLEKEDFRYFEKVGICSTGIPSIRQRN